MRKRDPAGLASIPGDPLAEDRKSASVSVLWDHSREIRELHGAADWDRDRYLDRLEQLTEKLWAVYLAYLQNECSQTLPRSLLSWLDEQVRTGPPEFMDRDTYPESLRKLEIFQLHRFNLLTGAYRAAADFLDGLIPPPSSPGAPAEILDLASGYGGFPIYLSSRFPNLTITGSDIQRGCIESARHRAEGRPNIRYEVINALNMRDQGNGSRLAVSILQAVYHFSPGQLARLICEGTRVGKRGIVITDAVRSPYLPVLIATGASLASWNPFFVTDAIWSGLRMYHSTELELIARIAVPEAEITVQLAAPAFNVVHVEPVGSGI